MTSEIVLISFQVAILVMSVVIHEVSHGLAALYLGDPTAKYAGRLTLNPAKHFDWIGSFLVPLVLVRFGMAFGWAKPVPYNPYNLRDQRTGPAIVGLAGPASNILLALFFGLIARFMPVVSTVKANIVGLLLRNRDYEGLASVISQDIWAIFFLVAVMIVAINILLAFFNLIPIPPLDGSKLLMSVLPLSTQTKVMLEQYGFFILLFVIFLMGGFLGLFLSFVLNLFFGLVVGV